MDTIKLSRTGWIILVIVIVLIIALAIKSINSEKQDNSEENRFLKLSKRWQKLQEDIESEMKSLKLTQEMKLFLEKKINMLFIVSKGIFIIVFVTVASLFYWKGSDVITSLLSSAGVISFTLLTASFLFVNRFADANAMIEVGRKFIRKVIYRKYGFDPTLELTLQRSIDEKKMEVSLIIVEVQQIPKVDNQSRLG